MLSFFGIRTQSPFAPEQVVALKAEFSKNMYPSIQEREEIASRLSLTKKQVNQWFSDHRFRFKSKKNWVVGFFFPLCWRRTHHCLSLLVLTAIGSPWPCSLLGLYFGWEEMIFGCLFLKIFSWLLQKLTYGARPCSHICTHFWIDCGICIYPLSKLINMPVSNDPCLGWPWSIFSHFCRRWRRSVLIRSFH